MLDQILRAFSNYERKHNLTANVLDINHRQYNELVHNYPSIFGDDSEVALGFHICLHSEQDQPHPGVRRMATWYEAPVAKRERAKMLDVQGIKIMLKGSTHG